MELTGNVSEKGRGCFAHAARRVVQFLHEQFPIWTWLILTIDGAAVEVTCLERRRHHVPLDTDATEPPENALRNGDRWCWDASQSAGVVRGETPLFLRQQIGGTAMDAVDDQRSIELRLVQPLWSGPDQLFGAVAGLAATSGQDPANSPTAWLAILAELLSALLQYEAREASYLRTVKEARQEAVTDVLTGLPNRRGWNELLRDASRRFAPSGSKACLLAIDVDDLKRVNDTRGHAQGDELLRRVAQVLAATARDGEAVARTGGDEFAVLSAGEVGTELDSLRQRFRNALLDAGIAVAIGGASGESSGEAAVHLLRLWADADAEMCRQKRGSSGD